MEWNHIEWNMEWNDENGLKSILDSLFHSLPNNYISSKWSHLSEMKFIVEYLIGVSLMISLENQQVPAWQWFLCYVIFIFNIDLYRQGWHIDWRTSQKTLPNSNHGFELQLHHNFLLEDFHLSLRDFSFLSSPSVDAFYSSHCWCVKLCITWSDCRIIM